MTLAQHLTQLQQQWYRKQIDGCKACGGSGEAECSGEYESGDMVDCSACSDRPDVYVNAPCNIPCPTCTPWRKKLEEFFKVEWESRYSKINPETNRRPTFSTVESLRAVLEAMGFGRGL